MRVGADAGEFPDSQAHRKYLFSRAFASFRVHDFQDRSGDAYSCRACPPADARQQVSREHIIGRVTAEHPSGGDANSIWYHADRRYANFPRADVPAARATHPAPLKPRQATISGAGHENATGSLLSCFAHCVSLRRGVIGIDTRQHSHPPLKPSAQGLSRQTACRMQGNPWVSYDLIKSPR